MITEPLPRTPAASRLPDRRVLRVTLVFFAAVCTVAALFVLATLALPGSSRAAKTIGVNEVAGHVSSVAMPVPTMEGRHL